MSYAHRVATDHDAPSATAMTAAAQPTRPLVITRLAASPGRRIRALGASGFCAAFTRSDRSPPGRILRAGFGASVRAHSCKRKRGHEPDQRATGTATGVGPRYGGGRRQTAPGVRRARVGSLTLGHSRCAVKNLHLSIFPSRGARPCSRTARPLTRSSGDSAFRFLRARRRVPRCRRSSRLRVAPSACFRRPACAFDVELDAGGCPGLERKQRRKVGLRLEHRATAALHAIQIEQP